MTEVESTNSNKKEGKDIADPPLDVVAGDIPVSGKVVGGNERATPK